MIGLVDEEKKKCMCVGLIKVTLPDQITMNHYTFQRVESFTCLGSAVTANNDASVEMDARLVAANEIYGGLQRHLESKIFSRKTKKTCITLIRPERLYGLVTYTLSTADENRLGAFERRILWTIYGYVKEKDGWRARYNRELGELDVVATVKKHACSGLDTTVRVGEDGMPKMMLLQQPGKSDAPDSGGWTTSTDDVAKTGVRNWSTRTQDRELWRKAIEEAKVHVGLLSC